VSLLPASAIDRPRRGDVLHLMKVVTLLAVAATAAVLAGAAVAAGAPTARSIPIGSSFTITGQTGAQAARAKRSTGAVVLSARWNRDPWRVVASSRTDRNGRYRIAITLQRKGLVRLRVSPPDGQDHVFVLRVD
jgi:hypothetical protein